MKFKGYDNINDIEKYLKKDLLVDREHAVELGENEKFYCGPYRHGSGDR